MNDSARKSSLENQNYLHGYNDKERERLRKQARFAETLVYRDIDLSGVQQLLEVGCGVGAQSEILLRRYPDLQLTGLDYSASQIAAARAYLESLSFAQGRFELQQGDATQMDFSASQFDGAFICWVLEHIKDPSAVLAEVRRVLKPGGILQLTEVLNSSFFIDPYSPATWKYWMAFNDFQYENGGDPFVGAKLGNLLLSAGYQDIETRACTWHLDNRKPVKRHEMIAYWTELLLSAAPQLIGAGCVDEDLLEDVRAELASVSRNPHAVFYYTFIQASARVY